MCVDGVALVPQARSFTELESTFNENLGKLQKCFQKWHLTPNANKSVTRNIPSLQSGFKKRT